ncbi:hypothetical protein BTVI_13846 [Pitangus sulphuratus]|nr:hypothetical protein BTVI_13846 [Pitangus sulphuratus]
MTKLKTTQPQQSLWSSLNVRRVPLAALSYVVSIIPTESPVSFYLVKNGMEYDEYDKYPPKGTEKAGRRDCQTTFNDLPAVLVNPAGPRWANVMSTYKKGRKEHPDIYKPGSLTLVPGKVMECQTHLECQTEESCGRRNGMCS